MARMRPSSKVNMNERGATIFLSHTEPEYYNIVNKKQNIKTKHGFCIRKII